MGPDYRNDHACSTFVKFIACNLKENQLSQINACCEFFSLQADASTDSGNVEDELFLILYFDPYCSDGKVHVCDKYFTDRELCSGTAQDLFDCLKYMGVEKWETKMIGLGCDGCSANMGDKGLRGLLKQSLPWVVVFWCVAHRLELYSSQGCTESYFFSRRRCTTVARLLHLQEIP